MFFKSLEVFVCILVFISTYIQLVLLNHKDNNDLTSVSDSSNFEKNVFFIINLHTIKVL